MTTAAESRREAARGNGTTGGQFGFQDHTPPASAPSAAWPGTNRDHRDHDFVPDVATDWPALYDTDNENTSGLGAKTFVAHYSGVGYDYWVCEYDPETREVFGYAQIDGHGDGEYGYADLNELEATRIQVFNPQATSVRNMAATTAAIHRDVGFEDLPESERRAHQHVDKYRGRILDELPRDERDEMNSLVAQWQAATASNAPDQTWGIRAGASLTAIATQQRINVLAASHGLVFDPSDGGTFSVAPTEADAPR